MIWICHIILCLLTVPHVNITSDILIISLKIDMQELMFYNFLTSLESKVMELFASTDLRKTESLEDFKDCLKFFLHMKDISTFS